jgi:hypothetical protein
MLMNLSGLSEEQFKATLGISGVPSLANFDPVAAMTTGNPALGENVFKVQQGLYTLEQALGALAAGGTSAGESALTTAMKAISAVFDQNAAQGGSVLSLADITKAAVNTLVVGDISDPTLLAQANNFAT